MRTRVAGRTAVVTGTLCAVLLSTLTGLPATLDNGTSDAAAAEPAPRGMRTEQAAQKAAVAAGEPVEVTSLRGERTETFANPDDTFTAKEYVQPVRARKGSKWVGIDTTLVKQPDGRYSPAAAVTGISFSGGGDTTFAAIGQTGRSLSIGWADTLPEPVVEGSTATYRDVLDGVDLRVSAQAEGFSHLLVVKDAEAAANPELREIALSLDSQGVEVTADEHGGLSAVDSGAGGEVFEAPAPMMWDSGTSTQQPALLTRKSTDDSDRASSSAGDADENSGHPTPPDGARVSDVDVAVQSDALLLTPDPALLTGKDTEYPVFIDPVVKTANRTSWTMVSSYYPSSEFWKFGDHEGVGRCPADVSYLCASTSDMKRQFFGIPTGTFEGKHILEAEFAVTMVHTYSTSPRSVELGRVNSSGGSAINSGTNWNNQPALKEAITSQSPTNPAGSCTSTNQNVRFDVRSTIQKAADSGWDTTTFRLKSGDDGDFSYWKRFCGNAHLEVKYNRPPYQPLMSHLSMSSGGSCEYGAAEDHYADEVPTLSAIIRDPDHGDTGGNTEKLSAKFKVYWTEGTTVKTNYAVVGPKNTHNYEGNEQLGAAKFTYKVGTEIDGDGFSPFTIPSNKVIGWEVQGYDGSQWGPWSSAGDSATRCEFIHDATKPKPPVVTSTAYPADDVWHDGVGDYGDFVLDSPSADVTKYKYRFTGQSGWSTATPATTGGPVTLSFMPDREGPFTLEAMAVDGAGNSQETARGHAFLVNQGRAPKAAWALGDPAGSTQAVGSAGAPAADAGSGVTFGTPLPGRSNEFGVTLDGSENGYLDAGQKAVDTDRSFSVSAWVSMPELPDTSMAVVSQDGTAEPGFALGYDGGTKMWSFRTPVSELETMGSWKVMGVAAKKNAPVHLIGVYDDVRGELKMYVNGYLVKEDIQPRRTRWNATGALQIGRSLSLDGYIHHFKGTIADVEVYDRVITEKEGRFVGSTPPQQLGYWPLEEAAAGVSPEAENRTGLTLAGSAGIYQADDSGCDINVDPDCQPVAEPMWGDGHLALDGTSAYAFRPKGLLPAEDSFTLSTRARPSSSTPARDQTVLSLPGTNAAAVAVRYSQSANRWQLVTTSSDGSAAAVSTATALAAPPSTDTDGDHLALVYDATFGDVLLYVDGQYAAQVPWRNTWDFSTTGLQAGRKLTGTTGGEYFSGTLDEIRAYRGALDATTVQTIAGLTSGCSLVGSVGTQPSDCTV
ncbi:LamG-like jellyroll fold domain-containing protein [Streptomyces dioscori]|uniref:LamG-like jellyroll fold domain-containing protein n=1 Tax=Streptomyces dioscori TaxID=2109333 RepID=UPI001CED8A77|nr:LamG-like jellyroll fold domain-containing protein [Streptomyces dioscori]